MLNGDIQSSTLAVVRWPTASENWLKFVQKNLYKYSNFEVFGPVNSKTGYKYIYNIYTTETEV
jgi:hypothetical protein